MSEGRTRNRQKMRDTVEFIENLKRESAALRSQVEALKARAEAAESRCEAMRGALEQLFKYSGDEAPNWVRMVARNATPAPTVEAKEPKRSPDCEDCGHKCPSEDGGEAVKCKARAGGSCKASKVDPRCCVYCRAALTPKPEACAEPNNG